MFNNNLSEEELCEAITIHKQVCSIIHSKSKKHSRKSILLTKTECANCFLINYCNVCRTFNLTYENFIKDAVTKLNNLSDNKVIFSETYIYEILPKLYNYFLFRVKICSLNSERGLLGDEWRYTICSSCVGGALSLIPTYEYNINLLSKTFYDDYRRRTYFIFKY